GLPVDGRPRRLDEDALAGRDLEVAAVEDLLGAPRLAVRDRPGLHLPRADRPADRDDRDRKGDPPECRALPVSRAPPTRAAGDVVGFHVQPASRAAARRASSELRQRRAGNYALAPWP